MINSDEGIACSNQDSRCAGSKRRRRRESAAHPPTEIGWEKESMDAGRVSRGGGHYRVSTRLSHLDLDAFMSTVPFYTWSTTQQSRHALLSAHGGVDAAVATKTRGGGHWSCTVKANMVMHEGEHYFEVELMPQPQASGSSSRRSGGAGAGDGGGACFMVGVAREGVDPDSCHHTWYGSNPQRAWLAFVMLGDGFAAGDRVGVLVDLDGGSLSFFKNGRPIHRPKQASGRKWQRISAPVVPAVQLLDEGDAVRFISDVSVPDAVIQLSQGENRWLGSP
jgi:hypothetical protein